ncbi:MAG: DNA polymerase III subunit [Clostridia bacterium]|nr:DNA polymerase III subunit [Clostridia bacterium]
MIAERIRAKLRGNPAVWQLVEAAAAGSSLHACVISGAAGTGKKTAAKILAQALVCTSAHERPCGVCTACKKVEKDIHPDVLTVRKDNKTGYSVDYVREIRQSLYVRPNEATRKIYIFADGDFLSPSAQNAMLKLLEEPPAYGAVFLVCNDPASLLETVRSRCTEVRTEPLPADVLTELLTARGNTDPEAVRLAVASANGSLGAAIEFLAGTPETEKIAVSICDALAATDEAALYNAYFAAERLSRDEIEDIYAFVAGILGDALSARFGAPAPAYPQFAAVSARLKAAFSPERLLAVYERARQCYDDTALYLTPGNLLAATVAQLFEAVTARLK